jgi:hypothetical protein
MRPVGPEPSETYWMRRALVVAAFLVLLIIILIFLFNLGGRPGQAAPAPTASATEPTSSASTGPTVASPEPTTTPSAPSAATASAKTSTKPSTSSKASARGKPSSSSKASASSRSSASSDPGAEPSDKPAKAKKTSKPAEPAEPKYAACDPDALRTTIKSDKHNVGVGEKVDFELSVINGGANPCSVEISRQSYQLKIFSGTDRIWSSDDCAKIEPAVAKILQPEQQVEWSMTWNGKRSDEDANCRARPEVPRPGYYYATSALDGAKPVQFLLILRG